MEDGIKQFLTANPFMWGVFIALLGSFFLMAAVFNWNIVFGDVSTVTYNMRKIDGWINMFGKKTARIAVGAIGALFIAGGLVWVVACLFVLK